MESQQQLSHFPGGTADPPSGSFKDIYTIWVGPARQKGMSDDLGNCFMSLILEDPWVGLELAYMRDIRQPVCIAALRASGEKGDAFDNICEIYLEASTVRNIWTKF